MATGIVQSVGVNGVNQKKDIRIIQAYLNSFAAWKKKVDLLKVDGYIGEKNLQCNQAVSVAGYRDEKSRWSS